MSLLVRIFANSGLERVNLGVLYWNENGGMDCLCKCKT